MLNNVEIYRRCYAQFTQRALPFNDTRLAQIRAATKTPQAACMEVLDLAKFDTTGNRLVNGGNPVALSVLNAMNQLHQTFFMVTDLPPLAGGNILAGLRSTYDPGEPALFYTKALFDSATQFKFVVTTNVNLRADRSGNAPVVSTENIDRSRSLFAANGSFRWASKGELLGVEPTGEFLVTSTLGNARIGLSRGGGVLGSPAYLLETVNEVTNFAANTATMPRRWAKSVFKDFLCREFPVARLVDTSSFVNMSATAHEFRQAASCTQCHASMDRLAAVNRNFRYQVLGGNAQTDLVGGIFPVTYATNATLDGNPWPAFVTADYNLRPTVGVLYYRDYLGNLVDLTLSGIPDLGAKLAMQNDFYICAAKHYYKYFTGVDVDVLDPTDSRYRNKGNDMNIHKNNVVNLGIGLKTHQSLRTLINNILSLEAYKRSDLGIVGQ
jgi:hypothetical protein